MKTVKCFYEKNPPGPIHYYTFKTEDDVRQGDLVWTKDSRNGHWVRVEVAYVDMTYDHGAEARFGVLQQVYLLQPVDYNNILSTRIY